VALRYFNVFGPRQDPRSQYAAVIPRFATRLLAGKAPTIFGDGEQTRDFTFVANVVEANWVAANHPDAAGEVFNIGCGGQTSLNQLVRALNRLLGTDIAPQYEPARTGDVRHSVADVGKARTRLGYEPAIGLEAGLAQVLAWYRDHPEASHGIA
jgi:nucleoside-diphosphate-sugar epimerase